jgi:hypothetical protein
MTPTISAMHQVYFAAGRYSASIGDGQLPHPGRDERIVEIYYLLPIYFWRTLRPTTQSGYGFLIQPMRKPDAYPDVRKKLGLNLVSEQTDKGRVYRIKDGKASTVAADRAKQAA